MAKLSHECGVCGNVSFIFSFSRSFQEESCFGANIFKKLLNIGTLKRINCVGCVSPYMTKIKLHLENQAEKATEDVTFVFLFLFKVKVNDNVLNRPEGDEEEVVFDDNEDGGEDEADIDAVSLVHEFEFFSENLSAINGTGNDSRSLDLPNFENCLTNFTL